MQLDVLHYYLSVIKDLGAHKAAYRKVHMAERKTEKCTCTL